MASIRQLYVNLTLRADDFNNKLRAAQREMREFEKTIRPAMRAAESIAGGMKTAGIAITALGLPVVALTKKAIDNAAALHDMSERTGSTVETLSALKLKADIAGVGMSDLEAAFRKGSVSIENAASGGKAAADSLSKIGLSADSLLKMSPDERFFAIAQGIAAIEDPSIKAGVAMEVWGRGGTELLTMVDSLKGGLVATVAEAKLFGVSLTGEGAKSADRFNESLTLLSKSFGGLMNAVVDSGLLDTLSSFIELVAKAVGAFAKAHPQLTSVVAVLSGLAVVVGPIIAFLGFMVSGFVALIPILTGAAAAITAVGAPIAAIIAGIALWVAALVSIGTAIVIFISENEELRTAVIAAWNEVSAAAGEVWVQVVDVFRTASEALRAIWGEWGPEINFVFASMLKTAGEMIKNIGSAIATGLKVVSGIIQAFHGLVTGDFTKFSAGLQKIWSALWAAIKNIIMVPINAIKQAIADLTGAVTGRFKAMYDAVVGNSYVPDMIEGIRTEFGRLDEVMLDPTRRAANGVMSSFKNMFDTVLGFARDWKGTLKNMLGDILGGIDLKAILKGDFGSILGSVKDVLGIGGGASRSGGGIMGGIFGGGGGAAAGAAGGAASLMTGIGALSGFVGPIGQALGKIGAGRDSANEIVKAQNAFEATLDGILKDSQLSATNKFKQIGNVWADFQANLARFSAAGGEGGVTANQAFATLSPLVSRINTDLMKQGASTGPDGAGEVTMNFYLTDVHSPEEFIEWFRLNRNGIREEVARGVQLTNGAVVSR